MSTQSDPTSTHPRDERAIPRWVKALAWAPWALFSPTCASSWLSHVPERRSSEDGR